MEPDADIDDFFIGDTLEWQFDFTDDSTGLGIDITGYRIYFTMKTLAADADPGNLQFQTTAGLHPSDDIPNGKMFVRIEHTLTDPLLVQSYFYDFQRVVPGSPDDVRTLFDGSVNVKQDITKTIV